jgi:hypothetical protein
MNNPPPSVLILGDTHPAEFQPVVELVHRRVAAGLLRTAIDIAAIRRTIASGWFPDILIVLQAWPDQFLAGEVEELISLCPLARLLCCFGPWCDSDGRTRSIWPLGARVPAAGFPSRFEHEVALLTDCRGAGPPLPLTASRTEIFEFDFARPVAQRALAADGVTILSPDRYFREMLSSGLKGAGMREIESQVTGQSCAIVFDADPWSTDRAAALATICTAHPQSPLVACVGFPRPHIEAELRRTGADRVWFKLSPLAALINALEFRL